MKIYTELKLGDFEDSDYCVEIGLRSAEPCFRYAEIGVASTGKTKATALRKAARNLEREAKKLWKQAQEVE